MSNTYAKEKLIIYKLFKSVGKIKCPAFPGEFIIFNSRGANHILFKGDHKRRNKRQRQIRLSLVKRAVSLISEMPYFQEYQPGGAGKAPEKNKTSSAILGIYKTKKSRLAVDL